MVDVTKQDITKIQCLFNTDNKEHNRNLHTLIINDITNPVYRKNLMYVKELTVIDKDQTKPIGDIKDIAAFMTSLTAINVNSGDKNSNMDFKQLFENLPTENVDKIELKGSVVLDQIKHGLGQFTNLQYLEISASEKAKQREIVNKICKSVKSCKLLNEVNLDAEGFPNVIQKLENTIKINLAVTIKKTQEIDTFVTNLKKKQTKPNISTLILLGKKGWTSQNKLSVSGNSVAELLVCLQGIQVLDLGRCFIEADTLREMSDVIRREEETRLDIKQLILGYKDIKQLRWDKNDI